MAYFVTGATGFIGRFLLAQLLERRGDDLRAVPVGVAGQAGRPQGAARRRRRPHRADRRRPVARAARRLAGGHRAPRRAGRALLPPRGDLRPHRRRRQPVRGQRRGHAARPASRRRRARRALPHGQLDRGRRALQGHLHRGHVRRGAGRRAQPLLPHQARGRARRAPGVPGAVAGLPAGRGGRALGDRRDRQDRRSVLLLQDPAAAARRHAVVGPRHRHRGRRDQPRPRRLRRQGDGLHRPPARPRRPGVPPHRPRAAHRRRAVQGADQGGQGAAADGQPRRPRPGHAAGAPDLDADAAARRQAAHRPGAGRARHPARVVPVPDLPDALRLDQDAARCSRAPASRCRRSRCTPRTSGSTGSGRTARTAARTSSWPAPSRARRS